MHDATVKTKDLTPKQIFAVPCTTCGAAIGEVCELNTGGPRSESHRGRKFSAAENRYDLVTGHFFLDCFTDAELVGTIARIAEWSTPDACWLVSDFREAQTRMGRLWTQAMIRGLYAGFRMMTGLRVRRVPDYAAALAAYGYRLRAEEERLGGLLFSSVWERSARRGGSEERRG